jgi:hypothetical protein
VNNGSTNIITRRRLVVSQVAGGGMQVRELSPDASVPYGGRLVGYTRSNLIGWVAAWNLDDYSETADVASAEQAEELVRAKLGMPGRPELPCQWCGMDPESPWCCGGNHPDRRVAAAGLSQLPVIVMGGAR